METLKAKLEARMKRAPKRPQLNSDDIQHNVEVRQKCAVPKFARCSTPASFAFLQQALEYRRTTRSLPLAEEKKIIQEINSLKALVRMLVCYMTCCGLLYLLPFSTTVLKSAAQAPR